MKMGKTIKISYSGIGGEAEAVGVAVVGVALVGGAVAAVIWIGVALRVLVKLSWV